ncbi:MAG: aminotransferase class IV [Saprospiraceae bacterium]|nr:aminotransferase class IV [Saprospiraceae bacterium]
MADSIHQAGTETDQAIVKNIIFNGRLVSRNQPLFSSGNRSFRYGDGLFESMRYAKGQIYWLDRHIRRLQEGMHFLGLESPEILSADYLAAQIAKLELSGPSRLRLSVFRSGGGTYQPQTDSFEYLIEADSLPTPWYSTNAKGLVCGIFRALKLSGNLLENIKSSNRLTQVLASRYAGKNQLDDMLIQHQSGTLAEGTASNLFLFRGKQLITPALNSGCLAGVMRSLVMEIGEELGYEIVEAAILPQRLAEFDFAWLTNSIQGIRWIERIEGIDLQEGPTRDFIQKLNQKVLK